MIKGGALIALFLMPFVVKSLHRSCEERNLFPDAKHARHECNNCPVCQFHYYTFTEVEPALFDAVPSGVFSEPFFNDEEAYDSFLYSCFLRGPPGDSAGNHS
jgi:hypothetical protein